MITRGLAGIKEALLGLKDPAGAAIFAAVGDIYAGYPHPDLIHADTPVADKPLVCVYVKGDVISGVGFRELLSRDDDTVGGTEHHRRDTYAVAEVVASADIYVLAATMDELGGSASWTGYVEQVILLARSHALIVGDEDTAVVWNVRGYDIPGLVAVEGRDRRLFLGLVKTTLEGKLVATPDDGAAVIELYPHNGDFSPTGP